MRTIYLLVFYSFFSAGTLCAQPAWVWAKDIHTPSAEIAKDIAIDKVSGAEVIVGIYNSSLSAFYGSAFTGSVKGGFAAKYDPKGNVIWGFSIGDNQNNSCNSVAIDSFGDIYITGTFEDTTEFKGLSAGSFKLISSGGTNAFIAKYNSSGQLLWVKQGGGSGDDEGRSAALNSTGVFICGSYRGTAAFGSFSVTAPNAAQNIFIAKYDYDGKIVWLANAGSDQDSFGNDIYADETNVFMTGDFTGTGLIVFDTTGVNSMILLNTNASKSDAYVISFSVYGAVNWGGIIGSDEDDKGYSVSGAGNLIYVAGSLKQSTSFPFYSSNPVSYSGSSKDMYVAAISKNSGITQWVKRENSTGEDEAISVAADGFGNMYLTGYYRNSISFSGGPSLNTPTGNSEDIFVVSYSSTGSFLWAEDAGDNGKDIPYGIACNLYKEAFVCGEYNKSADFGSTLLFNDGNSNAFIAKLGCPEILNNLISSSQVLCIGTAASDLSGSLPSGGTPSLTYKWEQSYNSLSWSPAAGVNDSQNYSPGVLNSDTYFRRIVYSSSACYNADISSAVIINIDQFPSQSALAADQTVCSSASAVSLIAFVPVTGTGLWAKVFGGAVISDPAAPSTFASGLTAGSNIFTYTISNGVCPASVDSIVFNVDALPDVSNAGLNRSVCLSDSNIVLNANAPAAGISLWTLASGTGSIAAVNDPHTAIYNIGAGDNVFTWTISSGVCPSSSSNVTIHADLEPDSAFAGNDISTDIPFVQLAANTPSVGNGRWSVISGAGDFSAAASASSTITGLEVGQNLLQWEITSGSCPSKKDEIIITMNPLHIPNAFSPNGDNRNDIFDVPGLEYYPSVNFKVFNKWGSMVYSNDDYKNEWTGRNRENEVLIDDTYYFILEVSHQMKYSGFVLIKTK